jgi:hypothetical protein
MRASGRSPIWAKTDRRGKWERTEAAAVVSITAAFR